MKLSETPYWSQADQAELDLLLDLFVSAVFDHRKHCDECGERGPWCSPLREAFDEVLAFQRERRLKSIAAWLRAREDHREAAARVRRAA